MTIHCVQHVAFENAGTIAAWASAHQYTINYTRLFDTDPVFPATDSFDVLLIMGGYMNADEEATFPWLVTEKKFIKATIEAGKKVLGICLGAQLIASALGAAVYAAAEKEIGFFPVQLSTAALGHPYFNHFSNPCTTFHWHGDTFDLPTGAELIASTTVCAHQAYLIDDKVLGLQFHFEMDETVIENMLLHEGHALQERGRFIADAATIRSGYHYLEQNRKAMYLLLDKFLQQV